METTIHYKNNKKMADVVLSNSTKLKSHKESDGIGNSLFINLYYSVNLKFIQSFWDISQKCIKTMYTSVSCTDVAKTNQ